MPPTRKVEDKITQLHSSDNQQKLLDVYAKAAQNKPALDSLLSHIAQRTGGRLITNFKNPDTTVQKTAEKQVEEPQRHYSLEDVNDVARGRLVYSSQSALKHGLDALKSLTGKHSNVEIAKEQDYFKSPKDGYRGYHVDLSFPNGQHVEVQLHTEPSYAAAMATHGLYQQFDGEAPEKIAERERKMNDTINGLGNVAARIISAATEARTAPQAQQAATKAQQVIAAAMLMQGSPQAAGVGPMGNLQ